MHHSHSRSEEHLRDTSLLQAVSDSSLFSGLTQRRRLQSKQRRSSMFKVMCPCTRYLRWVMLFAHHHSHKGSESLLGTAFDPFAAFIPSRWVHCMCSHIGFQPCLTRGIFIFKNIMSLASERQLSEWCPRFMLKCQPTYISTWPWGRWPLVFSAVLNHFIVLIKSFTHPLI